MIAGVEFNDKIEKQLNNQGKTHFIYNHDDISEMKGISLQQDSFDCGYGIFDGVLQKQRSC